ncbi:hypothetical protein NP493_155g03020 [Ridgeia piscesae]|uniref:Uncharacterized protein n=1 Tax=Ridgeia piscesae TaxID=27915 RepID=A0AAD9P424_RIDPI|nr:hypothetical protein NP493_155g03020 [Ridgeia piscesae]
MDSLFARPGGLLKFFHQHFKDAVEYSLLGCVSDIMCRQQRAAPPTPCEMAFHKQLAKFFYDQPHSSRRTEELPWHLERSGPYQAS